MNLKIEVFIKTLILSGVIFLSQTSYASDLHFGGQLFDKHEKQLETYDAVAAAIEYRVDGDGNEGYLAPKVSSFKGRLAQRTYDYKDSESAMHLYLSILDQLQVKKYKVIYTCEQEKCGEVLGWKLYLGDQIEGSESFQFYVLAERENGLGRKSIVAIYINEFSNRPRVFVTQIDNVQEPPLHTVLFDNGAAEVSEAQKADLNAAASIFAAEGEKYMIVGFSDDVGTFSANELLAKQRAVNVLEYLAQNLGVTSTRLSLKFVGEQFPVASNITESGRSLNRRVEIRVAQ